MGFRGLNAFQLGICPRDRGLDRERHARIVLAYVYGDAGGGGQLTKQTSPDGVRTSYAYDASGAVTSVTDGVGDRTSYAYDSLGWKTRVAYPDGTATGCDGAATASLDSSGATLSTTSAAYDGDGNQLSATDALGNPSTFTYDPGGNLTQELQPVSATSGITTSFGYDAAGNQTRYTDGKGSQWWDTYNSWGLQEKRIEPYTAGYATAADSTFTTAYNADKNPVTLTEPGGVTVTSTYNNLGELTGQSATDAATPARAFGYDTDGNLTSATTSNTASSGSNATSEAFTYNDRGLLLTASGSAGSTSYAYNGDRLVTSVADAAGTTGYTYDSAGRLATLADPATGTTATYSYNADSQVTGISYGAGNDTRTFGYDSQRRLTSEALKTSAGTVVASVGFGYNAADEMTSQTTTGLAGPASNTYTYDQAGRLTSWNNGTATTQYGYDANGNLTQSGSKTYTYDARDELTSDGAGTYAYTARGTPSTEPGPGGPLAVTFDAYGDQATAGARAYAYDALGRLTADTPAAGGGGYQFSYAGKSGTIASDGTSAYTWDPSGTALVGVGAPGGGTSGVLALANSHGDVLGQYTAAGTAVAGSRAYDPWGTVTATTGTFSGLLGYQSGWSDTAAGKTLMGARWYDPAAGDFTSADTVQVSPVPDPAAGNPFAYAADSPLDHADPGGHRTVDLPGDYGNDPRAAAMVIDTSHMVAERTGAAQAAAKSAAALTKAAKTPAQKKAAAAAVSRAQAAAEALAVAKTAQASAARAQNAAEAKAARQLAAQKAAAQKKTTPLKPKDKPAPAGQVRCNSVASRFAAGPCRVVVPSGSGGGTLANFGGGLLNSLYGLAMGPCGGGVAGLLGWPQPPCRLPVGNPDSGAYKAGNIAGDIMALFASRGDGDPADPGIPADDPGAANTRSKTADACAQGSSFTPDTRVQLANGKTVPIASLRPGDKVLATSTATGKTSPETVTAVEVRHDTDLYNLTVKTAHGTEIIHTTSNHLFWASSLNKWLPASNLKPGEHLKTPDGTIATADGGTTPRVHDGWMWDLTVPGNNDHDFYVLPTASVAAVRHPTYSVGAGIIPVLVHNSGCGPVENNSPGTLPDELAAGAHSPVYTAGTEEFNSAVAGGGRFLWATDVDGNLVMTPYSDAVKHTVLTGGDPVTGAGVVTINERGVVTRIDNYTGHYTPTQECSACFLQNGVDAFMRAGVPVPRRAVVDLGGK